MPWRSVRPTFWKKPALSTPPEVTNWMSSFSTERYTAAEIRTVSEGRRRTPPSNVRATTGLSGGAAGNRFGRLQGGAGPAQINSTGGGKPNPRPRDGKQDTGRVGV